MALLSFQILHVRVEFGVFAGVVLNPIPGLLVLGLGLLLRPPAQTAAVVVLHGLPRVHQEAVDRLRDGAPRKCLQDQDVRVDAELPQLYARKRQVKIMSQILLPLSTVLLKGKKRLPEQPKILLSIKSYENLLFMALIYKPRRKKITKL